MRLILYILSFCFFLNSTVLSDEKLHFYSKDADKLTLILPQGYCDFTKKKVGKEALKHLRKTLHNQVLEPKIVYSICNTNCLVCDVTAVCYAWKHFSICKLGENLVYNAHGTCR